MRLTLDLDIRDRDLSALGYEPGGEGRTWTRDDLCAALHLLLGRAIIHQRESHTATKEKS